MQFSPLHFPYPSRRTPLYARNGMVCTSQPLAAQAGLAVLRKGGNAVDAAVAAAAALTVVEPTSNGIGGDAFALVWSGGQLYGLNASGPAPMAISREKVIGAGHTVMPDLGFLPVTVPGTPSAWEALSERFGTLPLTELLAPAVTYAQEGYPVSAHIAQGWKTAHDKFSREMSGEEFVPWFETFAPDGKAPVAGQIWRSPDHARTLQAIAETRTETFYRGALAEQIDRFSRKYGGYLRASDLASYRPEWVEPICVHYRGHEVWEIPPNGHGLVTLLALNILKGFELRERDTAQAHHLQVEAMKLACVDGLKFIADPGHMRVSVADLLSEGYGAERRRLIGKRALDPAPGQPPYGGTVYLCTADGHGNMVSMIQSNYNGFGSGLVVPGTGIALHDRGANFVLDPEHANCLAPGKRPYHTIIPGFLTRDGEAVGPFGVMGGFMQPQGHLQVVTNTVDFGLNPQAALDAPRWFWQYGRVVEVERTTPQWLFSQLEQMGHSLRWAASPVIFGRGQIIWRQPDGVLVGGVEPRTDSQAALW